MTLRYELTEEHWLDGMDAVYGRVEIPPPGRLLLGMFTLGMLGLAIALRYRARGHIDYLSIVGLGTVATIGLVLVFRALVLPIRFKRQFAAHPALRGPHEISIGENGISGGSRHLAWTAFRVVRTGDSVVVLERTPHDVIVIPLAALSEAERAELFGHLSRNGVPTV